MNEEKRTTTGDLVRAIISLISVPCAIYLGYEWGTKAGKAPLTNGVIQQRKIKREEKSEEIKYLVCEYKGERYVFVLDQENKYIPLDKYLKKDVSDLEKKITDFLSNEQK